MPWKGAHTTKLSVFTRKLDGPWPSKAIL
jgi:hypothetical protein